MEKTIEYSLKNNLDEFKKELIINDLKENPDITKKDGGGNIEESYENAEEENRIRELYKKLPDGIKEFLRNIAIKNFRETNDVDCMAIEIYRKIHANTRDFLLVKPENLIDVDEDAYGRYQEIKKLCQELENIKTELNAGVLRSKDVELEKYKKQYKGHLAFFDEYRQDANRDDFLKLREQIMKLGMDGGGKELLEKYEATHQAEIGDYGEAEKYAINDNKAMKNLFKNLVNGYTMKISILLEEIEKK